MFSGAVILCSMGVYGYVVGGTTLLGSLTMSVGFALSGVAEALPAGRQRAAGGLRVAAIVLMLCLISGAAFASEYVV